MKRPEHLPDYTDPPLDEVVIGVQFAALQSYTPVHAKGVWDLFKDEFPQVLEQPLLDPQFETFGGMNVNAGPQFVFGAPPRWKPSLVHIARRKPLGSIPEGPLCLKLAAQAKYPALPTFRRFG